jgi:pimeloyl-ACP methyl ester carboxylesterase
VTATFNHGRLSFRYRDEGTGLPFVFQHGLGADGSQPFALFRPPTGVRLLCLDCRAHGQTKPLGDESSLSLATFADDLAALLAHLGIDRAVVGGISMGAAVALNLAFRHPERVLGLVLSRPAWVDAPRPANVEVFARIAALIRAHPPAEARERFAATEDYRRIQRESSDAAASLLRQFDDPRIEETVARLERIPSDTPFHGLPPWASVQAPALVMANRQDPIHPFDYGLTLARLLPNAAFREITPKAVSLRAHTEDVQQAIAGFLSAHFPVPSPAYA